MSQSAAAVVEVSRGGRCESRHLVDIVVADAAGTIHSQWGEADRLVFPRSAIKALQALPLVESGAADAYSFEAKQIALACASHNAEELHVTEAALMLEKAGQEPACLECGAQPPFLEADQNRLAREGVKPQALHNNCSGKHAGFLAFAAHTGIATDGYVDLDHVVQREIAGVLSEVTGVAHNRDNHGIDGCSIPTYAIPLRSLAIAFAKLGAGEDRGSKRARAMKRICQACMANPYMVAGRSRFDTGFMEALQGKVFTKTGAEGVFTAALPEAGLGIALKCHDGTTRAAEVATANVIAGLLAAEPDTVQIPNSFLKPVLRNWNGIETGSVSFYG